MERQAGLDAEIEISPSPDPAPVGGVLMSEIREIQEQDWRVEAAKAGERIQWYGVEALVAYDVDGRPIIYLPDGHEDFGYASGSCFYDTLGGWS